jgi:hypothetical protein
MRNRAAALAALVTLTAACAASSAEGPRVHRLLATPSTVAYGYYWAAAKPVLRIASGDVVDVDRLHRHGDRLDLAVAAKEPIQEMVDFVAATWKLSKHEAYQRVSIAGNVAVTQLVDKPNVGVHVRLPKRLFAAR